MYTYYYCYYNYYILSIHIHLCMYLHVYMYLHENLYVNVCTCKSMYYICICPTYKVAILLHSKYTYRQYLCVFTCKYTCMYAFTCKFVYMYMYMYEHAQYKVHVAFLTFVQELIPIQKSEKFHMYFTLGVSSKFTQADSNFI